MNLGQIEIGTLLRQALDRDAIMVAAGLTPEEIAAVHQSIGIGCTEARNFHALAERLRVTPARSCELMKSAGSKLREHLALALTRPVYGLIADQAIAPGALDRAIMAAS